MRRVAGHHNIRLDGISDLLNRARGASVMDVGCNRGLVGYEFACNGAELVHGCDSYEHGIETAREIFSDIRNVKSHFEIVDLTKGPSALAPFNGQRYDIMLLLATYHKINRVMQPEHLSGLIRHLGQLTLHHFAWRATSKDNSGNELELKALDRDLENFDRIHTSYLSETLGIAAIWKRRS